MMLKSGRPFGPHRTARARTAFRMAQLGRPRQNTTSLMRSHKRYSRVTRILGSVGIVLPSLRMVVDGMPSVATNRVVARQVGKACSYGVDGAVGGLSAASRREGGEMPSFLRMAAASGVGCGALNNGCRATWSSPGPSSTPTAGRATTTSRSTGTSGREPSSPPAATLLTWRCPAAPHCLAAQALAPRYASGLRQ